MYTYFIYTTSIHVIRIQMEEVYVQIYPSLCIYIHTCTQTNTCLNNLIAKFGTICTMLSKYSQLHTNGKLLSTICIILSKYSQLHTNKRLLSMHSISNHLENAKVHQEMPLPNLSHAPVSTLNCKCSLHSPLKFTVSRVTQSVHVQAPNLPHRQLYSFFSFNIPKPFVALFFSQIRQLNNYLVRKSKEVT